MEYGNVQKGLLGIRGGDLNPEVATEMGIDDLEGVYVASVEEESGAYDAGLKEGDIIKQIDNIKVHKFSELSGYLSSKRPGDKVEVTLKRDGNEIVKNVILKKQLSIILPGTGFTVKNLSKADKKKFGVSKGVVGA